MKYLRSAASSSAAPCRSAAPMPAPLKLDGLDEAFEEFLNGTDGREMSTTMAFVRLLTKLLRDKKIGKYIVPIVPDESRTFGMEGLFRQVGIYLDTGQLYEPVDQRSACSTTRKPRTARSWRKGSPRPGRCRRSSPPAPLTRRTAST